MYVTQCVVDLYRFFFFTTLLRCLFRLIRTEFRNSCHLARDSL